MDYEKQIDIIRDVATSVKIGRISILTGNNGAGKSLLRKMIPAYIGSLVNQERSVASISMESRTQPKHEFAALRSMGIDNPENPTSGETLNNIDMLVRNACREDAPRYLVIDEPEIGMGEEMVMALVIKLKNMFTTMPTGCLGVMVITHNRYIVEHLGKNDNCDFLNLEGKTIEEWLNRELIPTDLVKFEEDSLGLYRAINKRIDENKSKP